MKLRRVIITEGYDYGDDMGTCVPEDRFVVSQVQVNAIKPEPKMRGVIKWKPVLDVAKANPADLIDTTQAGPHPAVSGGKRIRSMRATRIPRGKAKRAKGAK